MKMELTSSKLQTYLDEDDYKKASKWKWQLNENGYACRQHWNGTRYEKMYLHRFIMNTPKGMDTDHINQNKLDNRKANLRIVNRSTNNFNTGINKQNTSGYKGVGWFSPAKLWRAYITHESKPKRIELGYFKTKEEAIQARLKAEKELGVNDGI